MFFQFQPVNFTSWCLYSWVFPLLGRPLPSSCSGGMYWSLSSRSSSSTKYSLTPEFNTPLSFLPSTLYILPEHHTTQHHHRIIWCWLYLPVSLHHKEVLNGTQVLFFFYCTPALSPWLISNWHSTICWVYEDYKTYSSIPCVMYISTLNSFKT